MKQLSNKPADMLGQLRQAMLPLGVMLEDDAASAESVGCQAVTFRESPIEIFSFADSVRKQRVAMGLTQAGAAKLVPVSLRTWKRWEREATVPPVAVQREALKALGSEQARRSCPGKRKLATLAKSHHLHWEKHKGWMFRPTVDMGPKVVGKRLKFRMRTKDLEEALRARELTMATLRKLGLTLKISKTGPKRRAKAP